MAFQKWVINIQAAAYNGAHAVITTVHIEHKTSSRNLYTTIHVFLSFSHTDDNMDAKLMVIDYEFCSYNYRAFDIANHFQEWMYEYTNKSYPYYSIAKDKFPSKETRVNSIVNMYLCILYCNYLKP